MHCHPHWFSQGLYFSIYSDHLNWGDIFHRQMLLRLLPAPCKWRWASVHLTGVVVSVKLRKDLWSCCVTDSHIGPRRHARESSNGKGHVGCPASVRPWQTDKDELPLKCSFFVETVERQAQRNTEPGRMRVTCGLSPVRMNASWMRPIDLSLY